MHLIVGLGNPGGQYAGNRHNIGFMAVDRLSERHGFSPWRSKHSAQLSEGRLGAHKVLLAKPETFMNLSGQAVGEIARFYKLDPSDVTVIHDELDLDPGRTRIKTGGGHGGHNGLKSIDSHLGQNYRRVRVGIGHPGHRDLVSSYVLKDFAKAENAWVDALCDALSDQAEHLVAGQSNDVNAKLNEATAPWRQSGKTKAPAPPRTPDSRSANRTSKHGQADTRPAPSPAPKEIDPAGPMAGMLKKLFGGKQTPSE